MTNAVFLDGKIIRADEGLLRRLSPGHLKGKGVFETMRISRGKVFFLAEHLRRLWKGLRALGLVCPYTKKEVEDRVGALLRENRFKEGRMRLTVWRERKETRISIAASLQPVPSPTAYRKGFAACAYPRPLKAGSFGGDVKSIEYRFYLQAYAYARRRGCDEAILLNRQGAVVEGSRTNIFFVRNGVLLTPALTTRCLKGVTRRVILRLARSLNLRARSMTVGLSCVLTADEAFLTNSSWGVMPLVRLNGRRISDGQAGPVTEKLLHDYQKLTRKAK